MAPLWVSHGQRWPPAHLRSHSSLCFLSTRVAAFLPAWFSAGILGLQVHSLFFASLPFPDRLFFFFSFLPPLSSLALPSTARLCERVGKFSMCKEKEVRHCKAIATCASTTLKQTGKLYHGHGNMGDPVSRCPVRPGALPRCGSVEGQPGSVATWMCYFVIAPRVSSSPGTSPSTLSGYTRIPVTLLV